MRDSVSLCTLYNLSKKKQVTLSIIITSEKKITVNTKINYKTVCKEKQKKSKL